MINGHSKERRYKLFNIDERAILTVISTHEVQDTIQLGRVRGLPDDSQIHGVQHSLRFGGWLLLVWNQGFPIVPDNCELPFEPLPIATVEVVELRRADLPILRDPTDGEIESEIERLQAVLRLRLASRGVLEKVLSL